MVANGDDIYTLNARGQSWRTYRWSDLTKVTRTVSAILVLATGLAACSDDRKDPAVQAPVEEPENKQVSEAPSNQVTPAPQRNAYFGDLHVHTTYSFDAFAFGTLATPHDAYRYALGVVAT